MECRFAIQSTDTALLERATQVAEAFARSYMRPGIVGIVFLGAIARGYYDSFADIDIALFQSNGAGISPPDNYIQEQGFEIHTFLSDYHQDAALPWDMAKRWAFSTHKIFYDPHGLIARLLQKKLPLQPEERKWLMIEGMTQSNWYADTLPCLWVARGDLVCAQHMFHEGITYFLNALFGLNNRLVADTKWQMYCAEQLPILPPAFQARMQEVMCVHAMHPQDVERRRQAFLEMWHAVLPLVEAEVQMSYEEFSKLV